MVSRLGRADAIVGVPEGSKRPPPIVGLAPKWREPRRPPPSTEDATLEMSIKVGGLPLKLAVVKLPQDHSPWGQKEDKTERLGAAWISLDRPHPKTEQTSRSTSTVVRSLLPAAAPDSLLEIMAQLPADPERAQGALEDLDRRTVQAQEGALAGWRRKMAQQADTRQQKAPPAAVGLPASEDGEEGTKAGDDAAEEAARVEAGKRDVITLSPEIVSLLQPPAAEPEAQLTVPVAASPSLPARPQVTGAADTPPSAPRPWSLSAAREQIPPAWSQGLVNPGAATSRAPPSSTAPPPDPTRALPAWSQGRVPPGAAIPGAPPPPPCHRWAQTSSRSCTEDPDGSEDYPEEERGACGGHRIQ